MSSVLLSNLELNDQAISEETFSVALPAAGPVSYGPLAGRPAAIRPLVDRASEEWSNSLTHGVGTVLSLAGGALLLDRLRFTGDWTTIAGCTAYIVTLVGVYACSTLSHYIERPGLKRTFRVLDQAFIYLLVVGSYTPVAVMHLYGGGLSVLFWTMWGVALCGFLSKTVLQHRVDSISTIVYVVLGCLPLLTAGTAWAVLPKEVLILFVLGGLCYTAGLYFFVRDDRVPYFHTAWHLLVMAGSACHFHAIYQCVSSAV